MMSSHEVSDAACDEQSHGSDTLEGKKPVTKHVISTTKEQIGNEIITKTVEATSLVKSDIFNARETSDQSRVKHKSAEGSSVTPILNIANDTKCSYEILWECKGNPLFRNSVIGVFDDELYGFHLETLENISPPIKSICHKLWDMRVQENPSLYNGSKFRLAAVTSRLSTDMSATENGLQSEKRLQLCVGLTSYKAFICTNRSSNVVLTKDDLLGIKSFHSSITALTLGEALQSLGNELFNNYRAFISDCLGVSGIVTTSDNYMILIQRSATTGEFQGFIDCPGGHPEPDQAMDSTSKITGESFIEQLFDSIVNEVVEEINTPKNYLSEPVLLGIARQCLSNGRPVAAFKIRCALDVSTVRRFYNETTSTEAARIIFVPIKHVAPNNRANLSMSLQKDLENLTPSCAFALDQFWEVCGRQLCT